MSRDVLYYLNFFLPFLMKMPSPFLGHKSSDTGYVYVPYEGKTWNHSYASETTHFEYWSV